jgi:digeranylgeranylglycerophospholipid reductase
LRDVIVIGGGPIGSHTACGLADKGYRVLVLEQKPDLTGRVCCAGIISRQCLESFSIDDSVILRRANSARLFSPSGRQIRLWRRENQAAIVDRTAFNQSMADRARAAGAEYLFSTKAGDIRFELDRIVVETAANGCRLSHEARVVVIATGFGSKLTETGGPGKPGDFVTGAQAEVEAAAVDEIEVYTGQGVAPGFFAWLVPTSPPKALTGLLSRTAPKEHLKKLLLNLKTIGKIDHSDVEIGCRGITIKPPKNTYGNRLIMVGDAAGQVKPTTGGGIYFGLLSADIAVRNLGRALEQDDLSAKSLSGYQKEWQQQLGRELKTCYRARRLYERLSDRQIDKIFDITIKSGADKALLEADELSFDWHGRAITRMLRQKALSGALAAMKIPLPIGEGRG